MKHTIDSEDEIPDLCKNIFFSKDKLYGLAWALAVVFVLGYGAAVAYAISNSVAVSKIESKTAVNENNIEVLNTQINKKLDLLLDKTKE